MPETVAFNSPQPRATGPALYQLYGMRVRSFIQLAGPLNAASKVSDVVLHEASPVYFTQAIRDQSKQLAVDDWFHHAALADGSEYLRWSGWFEFLISPDGRRVACHALNGASRETFRTYLASQVLSCALLKQGIEPLHATVVVVDGQAVAFLGNCGYGKSSLGAAFLRAGHALLTDDMLVTSLSEGQQPKAWAHPGPPRVKLFPRIARVLLGRRRAGTPLNPDTAKLIIPLADHEHCDQAVPLRVLYVLQPPALGRTRKGVIIRPLAQRQACLDLLANTFNTIMTEPARLARQFKWAGRLARTVSVKSLSYPHGLAHIPAILATIRKDLAQ